jgi:hypothetical protein
MQRTRKGDEESVWEAVVALSRSRPCGPPLLGKRFSLRPIVAHGELWWEQRSALTPYPNGCGVGRRFCPHPLSPSPARRGGTRTRQRLWLPSLVGGWCASRQARSVRPARAAPAARRARLGERAALSMRQQPIRMWYQAVMGSVKVNMLPLPRPALSARIVPCIASTSAFEIVSPMPVPPSARVRDFSTR